VPWKHASRTRKQLFEARESLRDRDEELDAVRALNQRLLREHNQEPAG
jgi:hypothetical protein